MLLHYLPTLRAYTMQEVTVKWLRLVIRNSGGDCCGNSA
jgi:hypothetical protein